MDLSIPQIALMSRLLDEALPLDAAGRRLWLANLPREYQELAPALRNVLLAETSQAAEADGLLPPPSPDSTDEAGARAANRLHPGARVGPYELIRPLGAGGMAQVWLARRADGAFKRNVALKVPALQHLRPDLQDRFARERDILASLEHPQIARFYDAGIDPNGLPYFAMEYVQGDVLPAWCDAHRLGVPERLKLVLQVLDALQYAHAHHVIHRDIKPSNILVNEAGEVRLLDFGVAKLLAQDEAQLRLTVVYGRALTPEYASPELARGGAIDPASDVYSLGVVLYELLTGNLPYGVEAARDSATRLEQAISSAEIARPSTHLAPAAGAARAVTQRKLARQLRGDLDAVVLKALAKAPSARYASAAAFADELRRCLNGQPVKARSDHLSYRFGKLLRRRPAEWAAAAAVVIAAAAVTVELVHTQRSVPVTATTVPTSVAVVAVPTPPERSIAVLPFADMSEKQDQEYFSDGLSEELISHLAHSPDLKVIARTSSFQFKGKNEDARSIASKLGVAHLLEGSVRKANRALRITVQLVRASDGAQLWSQTYDRNLVDIFKVQDEIAGKVAEALHVTFAQSEQGKSRPDVDAYNLVLEGNYLQARWTQPELERAIQLYRQALDLRPDYALAWAHLAGAYFDQQALTGTVSAADNKRILDALERAIRLDPNLALAYFTRAGFELTVTWDWKAAAADVERVRQIEPGSELLPRALGGLALTFGQVDRAVELYEKALDRDPLDVRSLAYLGDALCAANRIEECLQSRLRLLQLHPDFGAVYSALGATQLQAGQFDAALASIQKESAEASRLAGLAMAYSALGRREDSDAALRSLEDKFAASDAYAIAEAHAYRGESDAAFSWLERAYRQRDSGISSVISDPLLRSLHDDKRFGALLNKLGLAPQKPFLTNEGRT